MTIKPTHCRAAGLAAVMASGACSSAADDAAITEPTVTPGITYSAETSETLIDGGYSMLVTLSIENTSAAPITLTYPASCPIRIRLYQPPDNTLVYDETRVACTSDDPATMTISPGATRSIGSGFRRVVRIIGDSLTFTTYRVFAVPRTEAAKVLEVPAGSITLKP